MKKIKIALDWTPNINHLGIFIANKLGFYSDLGIELEILNPLDDDYKTTPGKKLELDIADFAIAPFETVISLNNKENVIDVIAVFAILQEDISSIASLKSSNLISPKLLDGKIYSSYKARYEDHIVIEMIKNDGGTGNIEITYPNKLGIWNTLLEQKADATWIFDNWEGIEADDNNIEFNKFRMIDFGIPYCYSPVILTKKNNINNKDFSNFIKATKKGYLYSSDNKSESISILETHLTDEDKKNINLSKSFDYTIPYFGKENICGLMESSRVNAFLNWLVNNNLENKKILSQNLFTNELIS